LVLSEPAACLTSDELSFRVQRALGKSLEAAEAMQLSVRLQAEPAGFEAQLDVRRAGQRGQRTLHAASCEELSEALVIAIVVAIGDAQTAEPAAPPGAAADSDAASEPPGSVEPPPPATPRPTIVGSAWVIGDTGTLPAPGVGAALGVAVGWPRLQLRAMGTLLPEREGSVNHAVPGSPGASIGLLAGSALACIPVARPLPSLGVSACAGWELGQLSGSGTHISSPYHQRTLWSAALLEFGARWSVPSTALSLELLLTAVAPFTRDEFILQELGTVYRPASVLGRVGLGVGLAID
jgi:hypothetical protein